jgi:hypothetical protein
VERDFTSTEFTQNDESFINFDAFGIDSVDVESHPGLTKSMWSLIQRLDSVEGESHCVLTQRA